MISQISGIGWLGVIVGIFLVVEIALVVVLCRAIKRASGAEWLDRGDRS